MIVQRRRQPFRPQSLVMDRQAMVQGRDESSGCLAEMHGRHVVLLDCIPRHQIRFTARDLVECTPRLRQRVGPYFIPNVTYHQARSIHFQSMRVPMV